MDLTHLSDEQLTKDIKKWARSEREALIHVLHHLLEVERRRLYCGCKNLFDYAMKVLDYDEPQASQRISAMKMLREIPALDIAIEDGELKLTHIKIARSVFENEKKKGREFSPEKKLEMFEAITGLTTREAERVAFTFAPEAPPRKDKITTVNDGNLIQGVVSDETLAKLEKIKGLLAHENPNPSLDELLSKLCDLGLKEWDPAKEPNRKVKPNSKASIKRAIWKRDGNACTKCKSTYAVQEDHIIPVAAGGEYTLENMRLLCQKCNQRAAIEYYGQKKMDSHLNKRKHRDLSRDKQP